MAKRHHPVSSPAEWENLPDEDILRMRIRDLGLRIEGTALEGRIQRLYSELESRGISFQPPGYLADEWLCPDREPVIGIPFYLAHPRLTQIERKMMLEVEGGTDTWCMKLLRHEAGHVMNYAFRLYTRTRWRELFGSFTTRYTNSYSAQPYSKRYVNHLEDNYAQAHPDEDFAETFAVWLTPGSNWEDKYREWPAAKKLHYVHHLMGEIGDRAPLVTAHATPWSASRMTSTLAAYYERRRESLGDEFPGFYDPGLQRIFSERPAGDPPQSASRFLGQRRRQIVNSVAMWTDERKYDIDRLVRQLRARCDDLQLYMHRPEIETMAETTAFVTAVMSKIHSFIGGPEHR